MKLWGYCENDDIVSQRIYNHWVGFNTFSVTISWSYFAVIIIIIIIIIIKIIIIITIIIVIIIITISLFILGKRMYNIKTKIKYRLNLKLLT